jgi:hypothetical protein
MRHGTRSRSIESQHRLSRESLMPGRVPADGKDQAVALGSANACSIVASSSDTRIGFSR